MSTAPASSRLSGFFLIAALAITGVASLYYLVDAYGKQGQPTANALLRGEWTASFEKKFGEALPIFNPSRNAWGQAEFAAFRQGRPGVVVGRDGWLFTDEEFSCPPRAAENLMGNLDYMAKTRAALAAKGTELAVALIPAKARLYSDKLDGLTLTGCRAALYNDVMTALGASGVKAINLYTAMRDAPAAQRDTLFLRTDTHWTPEGARLAAQTIATSFGTPNAARKEFKTNPAEAKEHSGDLLRYTPGASGLVSDTLSAWQTEAVQSGGEDDLFGGTTPDVTLVGTSYSANPLWHFEGFLKQAVQADILNMADQGLGPFAVMDTYLQSEAWQNSPPKYLIWEVPERYMLSPHELHKNDAAHGAAKVF